MALMRHPRPISHGGGAMLIAILSDIHDNIWALDKVLTDVHAAGAAALIFCGDFCAPFSLALLAERFHGPIHAVAGNNDGDMLLLARNAAKAGNVTLHGPFAELNLEGRRIFVTHYPTIGEAIAAGGLYDLVCCGHNHQPEIRRIGKSLLVNPGEVMGRFGHSTYAIYDTAGGEAQLHEAEAVRQN